MCLKHQVFALTSRHFTDTNKACGGNNKYSLFFSTFHSKGSESILQTFQTIYKGILSFPSTLRWNAATSVVENGGCLTMHEIYYCTSLWKEQKNTMFSWNYRRWLGWGFRQDYNYPYYNVTRIRRLSLLLWPGKKGSAMRFFNTVTKRRKWVQRELSNGTKDSQCPTPIEG